MKKREYIKALENALYVRKTLVACPECGNELDEGMPHKQPCPHYSIELKVIKDRDRSLNNPTAK